MRVLAFLLVCLLSCSALAATPPLSQRSLLLSGLWWSPDYSGNGFDIHVSGREVGVLWYSYRADGAPIWYLAFGTLDAQDRLSADLQEAQWTAAGPQFRSVGSLRLQRVHAELAALEFEVNGESGQWPLRAFRSSSVRVEADASGAYAPAANGGFGLTIDQQGDNQSIVYYAYDSAGRPTWLLGNRQPGESQVRMMRFRRECALCPGDAEQNGELQARLDTTESGLQLRFPGELAGIAAEFASPPILQRFTASAADRQADYQLVHFETEPQLHQQLVRSLLDPRQAEYVDLATPPIISPPPPTVSASTTNLVVPGVDEGDLLKSDGRYLYAVDQAGSGIRIAEFTAPTQPLQLRPQPLPDPTAELYDRQLFLTERQLIAVASGGGYSELLPLMSPPPPNVWEDTETRIAVFDRSQPMEPVLLWDASIDGRLMSARRIDQRLLLLIRYSPAVEGIRLGSGDPLVAEQNRQILEATELADLLPAIRFGARSEPLLQPGDVLLPPVSDQWQTQELAMLLSIDLSDPSRRETLAVLGGVDAMHVGREAIYFSTTRYAQQRQLDGSYASGFFASTDLHQFDLAPQLNYRGSGSIDGWINLDPAQQPFRFSDHQGRLRALSAGDFGARGRNLLSILEPSSERPGLLRTVASLPNAARPQPIGKPNEWLFSSRFVDDVLFAVTFERIDPLYAIDLSDPTDPRIRGELELPGFSEYLHPLAAGLLLGIGNHVPGSDGLTAGLKLVLFDVSDLERPQVLDEQVLGESGSHAGVFADHHAFSALSLAPDQHRIGLPVRIHGDPHPSPAQARTSYQPLTYAGLQVFDVTGVGSAARLQNLGSLRASLPGNYTGAYQSGRALLRDDGVVYLHGERFWSSGWDALTTPIGPQ